MSRCLEPVHSPLDKLCLALIGWPCVPVTSHHITCFCIDRDLGLAAVGCQSGWVYLWKLSDTTGFQRAPFLCCVAEWAGAASIIQCYFVRWPAPHVIGSLRSKVLCSHHGDGLLRLWALDDGRCLFTIPTLCCLGSPVVFSAVLPDSRFVALASHTTIAVMDLWTRLTAIFFLFAHSETAATPNLTAASTTTPKHGHQSVPFIRATPFSPILAAMAEREISGHHPRHAVDRSSDPTASNYGDWSAGIMTLRSKHPPSSSAGSPALSQQQLPFITASGVSIVALSTNSEDFVSKEDNTTSAPSRTIVGAMLSDGRLLTWDIALHLARWCRHYRFESFVSPASGRHRSSHKPDDQSCSSSVTPPPQRHRMVILPDDYIPEGSLLLAEPSACLDYSHHDSAQVLNSSSISASSPLARHALVTDESILASLVWSGSLVIHHCQSAPVRHLEEPPLFETRLNPPEISIPHSSSAGNIGALASEAAHLTDTAGRVLYNASRYESGKSQALPTWHNYKHYAFFETPPEDNIPGPIFHCYDSSQGRNDPGFENSVARKAFPSWIGIRLIKHIEQHIWKTLWHQACVNGEYSDSPNTFLQQEDDDTGKTETLLAAFDDSGRVYLGRCSGEKQDPSWNMLLLTQLPPACVPALESGLPLPLVVLERIGTTLLRCSICAVAKNIPDQVQYITATIQRPKTRLSMDENKQRSALSNGSASLSWKSTLRFEKVWASSGESSTTKEKYVTWTGASVGDKYFLVCSRLDGKLISCCLNPHRSHRLTLHHPEKRHGEKQKTTPAVERDTNCPTLPKIVPPEPLPFLSDETESSKSHTDELLQKSNQQQPVHVAGLRACARQTYHVTQRGCFPTQQQYELEPDHNYHPPDDSMSTSSQELPGAGKVTDRSMASHALSSSTPRRRPSMSSNTSNLFLPPTLKNGKSGGDATTTSTAADAHSDHIFSEPRKSRLVTALQSIGKGIVVGGTSDGDIFWWALPNLEIHGALPGLHVAPVAGLFRIVNLHRTSSSLDPNRVLSVDTSGQLIIADTFSVSHGPPLANTRDDCTKTTSTFSQYCSTVTCPKSAKQYVLAAFRRRHGFFSRPSPLRRSSHPGPGTHNQRRRSRGSHMVDEHCCDSWTINWSAELALRRSRGHDGLSYVFSEVAGGAAKLVRLPRHPDLTADGIQKVFVDTLTNILIVVTSLDLFLFNLSSDSFITTLSVASLAYRDAIPILADPLVDKRPLPLTSLFPLFFGSTTGNSTAGSAAGGSSTQGTGGGLASSSSLYADSATSQKTIRSSIPNNPVTALMDALGMAGAPRKHLGCIAYPFLAHPCLWASLPSIRGSQGGVWVGEMSLGRTHVTRTRSFPSKQLGANLDTCYPSGLLSPSVEVLETTTCNTSLPILLLPFAPVAHVLTNYSRHPGHRRPTAYADHPADPETADSPMGANEANDAITFSGAVASHPTARRPSPVETPVSDVTDMASLSISEMLGLFLPRQLLEPLLAALPSAAAFNFLRLLFDSFSSRLSFTLGIIGSSLALSIPLPQHLQHLTDTNCYESDCRSPEPSYPEPPRADSPRCFFRCNTQFLRWKRRYYAPDPISFSFPVFGALPPPAATCTARCRRHQGRVTLDLSPMNRGTKSESRPSSVSLHKIHLHTNDVEEMRRSSFPSLTSSGHRHRGFRDFHHHRHHRRVRSRSMVYPTNDATTDDNESEVSDDQLLPENPLGRETPFHTSCITQYAHKHYPSQNTLRYDERDARFQLHGAADLPIMSGHVLAVFCLVTDTVVGQLLARQHHRIGSISTATATSRTASGQRHTLSSHDSHHQQNIRTHLLRVIFHAYRDQMTASLPMLAALCLHPYSSFIRETARLWLTSFAACVPLPHLRNLVEEFAFALSTSEKLTRYSTGIDANRKTSRELTVPVTNLFFTNVGLGDATIFPKGHIGIDLDLRLLAMLLLAEILPRRPMAAKAVASSLNLLFCGFVGQLYSRYPEPVTLLVARHLIAFSGPLSPNGPSTMFPVKPYRVPKPIVYNLLESVASGYGLIWRKALFGSPGAGAIFEWKLWRSDIAVASAAADIAADQASQKSHNAGTTGTVAATVELASRQSASLDLSNLPGYQYISGTTPLTAWRIELVHTLIFRIYGLSLQPEYVTPALLILLEIGRTDPLRLIRAMGFAAKRLDQGQQYASGAVFLLARFFVRHPVIALNHLCVIVDAIIKCLDPSNPSLRRSTLASATSALFQLVRVFPMITFHQATQRFAVGNSEGLVIIYDLRTATKWRVIDAHSGEVSALGFSDDGSEIASYSAKEQTFCLWQCASTGFLGGILGASGKCLKLLRLPRTAKGSALPLAQQLPSMRLVFKSKGDWILRREDGKGYAIRL